MPCKVKYSAIENICSVNSKLPAECSLTECWTEHSYKIKFLSTVPSHWKHKIYYSVQGRYFSKDTISAFRVYSMHWLYLRYVWGTVYLYFSVFFLSRIGSIMRCRSSPCFFFLFVVISTVTGYRRSVLVPRYILVHEDSVILKLVPTLVKINFFLWYIVISRTLFLIGCRCWSASKNGGYRFCQHTSLVKTLFIICNKIHSYEYFCCFIFPAVIWPKSISNRGHAEIKNMKCVSTHLS